MSKRTKKETVNATVGRKGHQLPARAPEPMWSVLQNIARTERRSVAQTVLILLEEALKARGHELPRDDRQE